MPKSTQLPMKPLMMPRTEPMTTLMMVAEIAMNIDRVTPDTSRDSTSRPVCGSTPKRVVQAGAAECSRWGPIRDR